MIFHSEFNEHLLTISVKPQCLIISQEYKDHVEVVCFDNEGRLWTALRNNVSYRRGLDGKTVAKWLGDGGQRHRRWISPGEADDLAQRCQIVAQEILQSIVQAKLHFETRFPASGLQVMQFAADNDRLKRDAHISRYHTIYLPVGILPPDQYGAVVLQATEGCSFNSCTFCSFYHDRPFRIKDSANFEIHCQDVKRFLGKGLALRRTIFLGDANALVIPMDRLIHQFEIIHNHYDVESLGGIYAFLDGMTGEKKSAKDYARLVSLGLKRVYIGLESGNAALLRYLNKPSTPDAVINTIQTIKRGGASVGVIILLGAGGKQFAVQHVKETIKVINQLALDVEDIIYFSELIESEDLEYQQRAFQQNLHPLSTLERLQQGAEIENGLIFSDSSGIPHISRYDIREFVY